MIDPDLIRRSINDIGAAKNCLDAGVGLAILAHEDSGCTKDLRDAHADAIEAIDRLMEMAKHGEKKI